MTKLCVCGTEIENIDHHAYCACCKAAVRRGEDLNDHLAEAHEDDECAGCYFANPAPCQAPGGTFPCTQEDEFPMGEFPTGREYTEQPEDFWARSDTQAYPY